MVPEYSEIFFSRFGGPILAKRLVSGLSEPDKQRLSTIMRNRQYDQGQTIFARDVIPAEILILTRGTAELKSGDSADEIRTVDPGEVLGLTETLAEAKYSDTLTAVTDCETNVIARDDLIWYLRNTPEACYRSLEVVAENFHQARDRAIGDY
jgi:CRP-like cAMP-binding protein